MLSDLSEWPYNLTWLGLNVTSRSGHNNANDPLTWVQSASLCTVDGWWHYNKVIAATPSAPTRNNFYSKWFETRCSWHNLCFDFCKTIHSTENILCRNFGCPQRDIPVDMDVVDHWKSCILCTLFGTWSSLMFRNHLTSDPVTSGAMLRGQPCTSIGSCSLPFAHPVAYYTRHQQRQFLSAQWGIIWIL